MTKVNCEHNANHQSHAQYLPRINRISGQICGIKKMMEKQRYCPDIITQLQAVRAAIKGLALELLDKHISSCVKDAFEHSDIVEQTTKIEEIKSLIKKFD